MSTTPQVFNIENKATMNHNGIEFPIFDTYEYAPIELHRVLPIIGTGGVIKGVEIVTNHTFHRFLDDAGNPILDASGKPKVRNSIELFGESYNTFLASIGIPSDPRSKIAFKTELQVLAIEGKPFKAIARLETRTAGEKYFYVKNGNIEDINTKVTYTKGSMQFKSFDTDNIDFITLQGDIAIKAIDRQEASDNSNVAIQEYKAEQFIEKAETLKVSVKQRLELAKAKREAKAFKANVIETKDKPKEKEVNIENNIEIK
jgi:hypothetical protein